jgi:putative acetyltransferase
VIQIRHIQPADIPAVKQIILTVAYGIFGWDGTLEESILHFEASGEFEDVDQVQPHYFGNHGIFLVALKDDSLVGSGALRKIDDRTAELKRIWLLDGYQGQGIGYMLITRLFDFARTQGYERIVLQTSAVQTRALAFYRRVGFHEIPPYTGETSEISMEILLEGTKSA